jgi:hypothetical protein
MSSRQQYDEWTVTFGTTKRSSLTNFYRLNAFSDNRLPAPLNESADMGVIPMLEQSSHEA